MGIIVLQKLEAKPRTILRDGRCIEEKSSAFVGATDDELCQFGIGLLNEEKGKSLFWALLCPHRLITAWKGVRILDQITNIQSGTICHAFYAGMSKEDDNDVKRAVTALTEQIPEFEKLHKTVLETKIDDDTLNAMLKVCNSPENHIDVCISELKEAVQAGIIHQTEEVSRAYKIAIDKQLEYERDEKISKQPLPNSKSFRNFCEKCGITNLFDNPYFDWPGYWSMEKVDEILVLNGLRFEGTEQVWCTEKSQNSSGTGHIGQPVLRLNDQREVVLTGVRFKDNDMWGKIYQVKSEDEGEWTPLSKLFIWEPHFVGLTFDQNDKPTTEDMSRGYIAVPTTKNPLKKIWNAIASS